jgi:beta-lactamase regulating signal transducer with metallopeptidase domain
MLATLAEAALRSLLLGGVVWLGLSLFRAANPHVQKAAWTIVLVASLLMPLTMRWATVTITVQPAPVALRQEIRLVANAPAKMRDLTLPQAGSFSPTGEAARPSVDGWTVVTLLYAIGTGLLLLRLAIGTILTWRMAHAATPIRAPWTDGLDIRVSADVGGPVTFGSVILLPSQSVDWDMQKRRAVLAHERAHIASGDFFVLLLAQINRAVFWFSPLAWWLPHRLIELAEVTADARAIEALEDRTSYAELLLELVQSVQHQGIGLEMARASMVPARIDRILAAVTMPPRVGWRTRLGVGAAIVPLAILAAGSVATRMAPARATVGDAAATIRTDTGLPQIADFYALGPTSVFTVFRDGGDLFGQVTGQPKLRLAMLADGAYSYAAATGQISFTATPDGRPSALTLSLNGHDLLAARIAELPRPGGEPGVTPLDEFVGYYQLASSRVLTVVKSGERLRVRETGRSEFEVAADGTDAFSSAQDDLIIFLRNPQKEIAEVLVEDPQSGARRARRIDQAKAMAVEAAFAQRIAEAPERFREQVPQAGSKETILRGIANLQDGNPNYERMSVPLAAKIRRQASELQTTLLSLGKVESIFFRGVGPGGYDIYGVKFANGSAEFRVLLGADDKVEDVLFQPNGNDEPGGIVSCSSEASLKSTEGTAPIKIQIYNASGAELALFSLDAHGHRAAHGTIADNMWSSILTNVDSPWVVADRSGRCLEIVLPGQRTRYHAIETSHAEASAQHRSTPQPQGEDKLRQYIEAVGRGQPDYRGMTAQVAAQTRQQLPFDQAILTRLGVLRAISFRGVTPIGTDVYIAHFANGSAEWRISLAKDGTIDRIALGPQY